MTHREYIFASLLKVSSIRLAFKVFFINGMFFNAETYEGDYKKLKGMELFPSTNKQNNWILVKLVVNE